MNNAAKIQASLEKIKELINREPLDCGDFGSLSQVGDDCLYSAIFNDEMPEAFVDYDLPEIYQIERAMDYCGGEAFEKAANMIDAGAHYESKEEWQADCDKLDELEGDERNELAAEIDEKKSATITLARYAMRIEEEEEAYSDWEDTEGAREELEAIRVAIDEEIMACVDLLQASEAGIFTDDDFRSIVASLIDETWNFTANYIGSIIDLDSGDAEQAAERLEVYAEQAALLAAIPAKAATQRRAMAL